MDKVQSELDQLQERYERQSAEVRRVSRRGGSRGATPPRPRAEGALVFFFSREGQMNNNDVREKRKARSAS